MQKQHLLMVLFRMNLVSKIGIKKTLKLALNENEKLGNYSFGKNGEGENSFGENTKMFVVGFRIRHILTL